MKEDSARRCAGIPNGGSAGESARAFAASGKVLLIANPTSQHGRAAVAAARVESLMRERLGSALTVLFTQWPGHAEQLASAAEGFDLVVVVGGDGSAHEAANGLLSIPADRRPALGVIPAGSGNDYAHSLGMSPLLEESVGQLMGAPRRWLDVGVCNGRHFVETLSFGLDAAIARDTVERRKRTGASGAALYMRSGIDQLLHHLDFHRMSAVLDGRRLECQVVLIAVQVGPTYGGGFRICPDACFDDGVLDVCMAHAPVGVLKAAYVFLRAKNGNHRGCREIESLRVREASLRFDAPLAVQIDGERMEGTEFKISVEPAALRVVAPDGSSFSR